MTHRRNRTEVRLIIFCLFWKIHNWFECSFFRIVHRINSTLLFCCCSNSCCWWPFYFFRRHLMWDSVIIYCFVFSFLLVILANWATLLLFTLWFVFFLPRSECRFHLFFAYFPTFPFLASAYLPRGIYNSIFWLVA